MLLPVFDYTQCLMLHISIINKICILQMSFMVMSLILFLLLYTCITRVRFNQQSESRFMLTLSPFSVYWQRDSHFLPPFSPSYPLLFTVWLTFYALSLSLSCLLTERLTFYAPSLSPSPVFASSPLHEPAWLLPLPALPFLLFPSLLSVIRDYFNINYMYKRTIKYSVCGNSDKVFLQMQVNLYCSGVRPILAEYHFSLFSHFINT